MRTSYYNQATKAAKKGDTCKCEECPKEFIQHENLQKRFCSAKCRKRASRRYGHFISYAKLCKHCTKPFKVADNSQARRNYCKDACKQDAYRVRKKQKAA